jgi:hypothetical protein
LEGDPIARAEELRDTVPAMLCFLPEYIGDLGHSHCVVADKVTPTDLGYDIHIWNSNTPYTHFNPPDISDNVDAVSQVVHVFREGNRYYYDDVLQGTRLLTPPISIYEGYVNAPSLLDVARYSWAWAFGSADAVYVAPAGGRLGTTPDGVEHTEYAHAGFAPIPELAGPPPVLLPIGEGAPKVELYQHGGDSHFYLASAGRQIDAATSGAHAGEKDIVTVRNGSAGALTGFKYQAQGASTSVRPLVGLDFGDRQVATFQWSPLALGAGKDVEVGMDAASKSATLANRAGGPRVYTLIVNSVDGASSQSGTFVYAGLGIAQGATQRVRLSSWPDAGHLVLETDANSDGTYETSVNLTASRCDTDTADCNHDRVADTCDVLMGLSQDVNHDNVPDECWVQ